jgi:hypothetical protein
MGHAAAISAVAGDKEISFEELQFGQQIGEGGFGKVRSWQAQQCCAYTLASMLKQAAGLLQLSLHELVQQLCKKGRVS